ncbi:MAG: efflux RND transporter periplasmic adaptor subunit [Ruminococcus sp.]|nr:efflux RND transporter periplasmic adaptor subunit [Ruminococcus sp.]
MSENNTETYTPNRKRDIIKNILIIFLIIMLILTFCSNTIMNKSLAEITTETATSGKLTERIRGSGLVESNQSYEVKTDGNKVIDTIMIKTGQEVKKDDVLFTIGTEESKELEEAETALNTLELEYQKALLVAPQDYSAENQAINNARDDLNNAIAKRNKAVNNSGTAQQELYAYNNNKNELAKKSKTLDKLQSTIIAIDSDSYSGAAVEYSSNLSYLYSTYTKAESEYNSAYQLYSSMLSGMPSGNQSEEFFENNDYENNENFDNSENYENNDDSENNENNDMADNARVAENQENEENNNNDNFSEPVQYDNSYNEDLEVLKADMEYKASVRDNALNNYNNTKYSIRNNLMNQLYTVEAEIDSLNLQISNYESSQQTGGDSAMSIDAYDEEIRQKQQTLENLIAELNKSKSKDDLENKTNMLEIDAKKKEVDKMKEKIEKIKAENSITEIKSKYNGIVSSINIKVGEETVPDTALAVIDIADEGYTVELTVDAEKARKIKKGIEADVVNNWNGDITAILTDIKNDTKAGSKDRILTFSVTGDVNTGTMIDLSIPCGSGNYDTIVPKSAVYKDSKGSFVLVVNSKSSPLGNRYFADRVDVEVIASDEVSSAVQGGINSGDYIITTASKPVSPKDQVRMKDN